MVTEYISPKNVLLYGIDNDMAEELTGALQALDVTGVKVCDSLERARQTHPDVVFCSNRTQDLVAMHLILEQTSSAAPLIVVSRHPEAGEWIDAIEAGASDYCAPPFEHGALRWLLECNIQRQAVA